MKEEVATKYPSENENNEKREKEKRNIYLRFRSTVYNERYFPEHCVAAFVAICIPAAPLHCVYSCNVES